MNLPHVIIKGLVSQDRDGKDISPRSTGQYVKRNAKYFTWKKNMKTELCWSDLFRRAAWTRHRKSFCLMVVGYVLLTFRKVLVWVGDNSSKG